MIIVSLIHFEVLQIFSHITSIESVFQGLIHITKQNKKNPHILVDGKSEFRS